MEGLSGGKTYSQPDQLGNNPPFGGRSGLAGLFDIDKQGESVPGGSLVAIPANALFYGGTGIASALGLGDARSMRGGIANTLGLQRDPNVTQSDRAAIARGDAATVARLSDARRWVGAPPSNLSEKWGPGGTGWQQVGGTLSQKYGPGGWGYFRGQVNGVNIPPPIDPMGPVSLMSLLR